MKLRKFVPVMMLLPLLVSGCGSLPLGNSTSPPPTLAICPPYPDPPESVIDFIDGARMGMADLETWWVLLNRHAEECHALNEG